VSTTNFDRYDLANSGQDNVREDLSDVITNIDPTETPFISYIAGKGKAANTYFEWLIDDLGAVDGSNALVDGADAGTDDSAAADRVGNYAQISGKVARVSGRAQNVNKAGRSDELKYQIAKLGKALKRDMETIATGNQASLAGTSSVASTTGSLRAWIATNDDLGATGASGGFSAGIVAAATDGTARALSEATLLGIVKDCYVAGGNPSIFMVSPTVKQLMSQYMFGSSARIATPYKDAVGKQMMTAIGAVDVYVSDFGEIKIIPNRFQRDRDVFVLDKEMWEIKYLRPFHTNKLSKTGDAENRQLLVDWGVCSKNEAASGCVADVDHTTAMVA
jgi:hypothetical protein